MVCLHVCCVYVWYVESVYGMCYVCGVYMVCVSAYGVCIWYVMCVCVVSVWFVYMVYVWYADGVCVCVVYVFVYGLWYMCGYVYGVYVCV